MSEQFANYPAATTVAVGGYTAGSGVLNVASTAGSFPGSGTFTVVIQDQTTGAAKVVLRVSAINSSTQFAVAAEGTDANANAGDNVYAVLSAAAMAQFKTDCQQGTDGAWTAMPTYQNGWSDFGGGFQVGQYKKDRTGRVFLRGLIKPGTQTANTLLFTLPSGFRPPATMLYQATMDDTVVVRVDIASTGTVTKVTATTSLNYLELNELSFDTNS